MKFEGVPVTVLVCPVIPKDTILVLHNPSEPVDFEELKRKSVRLFNVKEEPEADAERDPPDI